MTILRTEVPIKQIEPDADNPRIAEDLLDHPNPSPRIIFKMLGAREPDKKNDTSATYSSLKESIRANKTLISPIILSQNSGKYIVIEGNTRLAIYNELLEETGDPIWEKIPAEIYDQMSDKQAHAIRLQAHLVGVREWTPFAKGKFLYDLTQSGEMAVEEMINICGGRKQDILKYINAYRDMKENYLPLFEGQDEDEPDYSRFSSFVEIQQPKRMQALEAHGFSLQDFGRWLTKDPVMKIQKNEDVRSLVDILSNESAKKTFLALGSREAIDILIRDDRSNLSKHNILDLTKELTKRIQRLEHEKEEFYAKNKETNEDVDAFVSLRNALNELFQSIGYPFED
jgi:hypothetical protein